VKKIFTLIVVAEVTAVLYGCSPPLTCRAAFQRLLYLQSAASSSVHHFRAPKGGLIKQLFGQWRTWSLTIRTSYSARGVYISPYISVTASVVYWSEFLATDPEDPGSIPGATRFSEK
jgi:hypothetical protein